MKVLSSAKRPKLRSDYIPKDMMSVRLLDEMVRGVGQFN